MPSARTLRFLVLCALLVIAALGKIEPRGAEAASLSAGDILTALGHPGRVQQYDAAGNLKGSISTTRNSYTTGMAFDSAGNLYVTTFDAGTIEKYSPAGVHLGTWASGLVTPEAIAFANNGNAYVTSVGGAGIYELSRDGAILRTFAVGGTDWLDISSDNSRLVFTTEGSFIGQIDIGSGNRIADFCSNCGGRLFALRFAPDGTLFVADQGGFARRFNSSGTQIQTYDAPGLDFAFALNLDPSGRSFWTGDPNNGRAFKFDISSGSALLTIDTGAPGQFYGLAVVGEITVANPPTRVVVFIQGITSESRCDTTEFFENWVAWNVNMLNSRTSTAWISVAAGLNPDQAFNVAYYGYFSSLNTSPECAETDSSDVGYQKSDTCWTIDDEYKVGFLSKTKTTNGQGQQFAKFLAKIIEQEGPNVKIDIMAHSQGATVSLYAFAKHLSDEERSKINSIVTFDGVVNGLGSLQEHGRAFANLWSGDCRFLPEGFDSVDDMNNGSASLQCIRFITCERKSVPLYEIDAVPGYLGAKQCSNETSIAGGIGASVTHVYGQWVEIGGQTHSDPYKGGCTVARSGSSAKEEKLRLQIYIGCAVSKAFGNCERLLKNSALARIQPFQTVGTTLNIQRRSRTLRVVVGWSGSTVSTSLVSPSGRRIQATSTDFDVRHVVGETAEYYEILSPEEGQWLVESFGTDVPTEGEDIIVSGAAVPDAIADADGDDIFDDQDNCPAVANSDQVDTDGDQIGNACDPDLDGDGVENSVDNCRYDANLDQVDVDGDGAGDACDEGSTIDTDLDGVPDDQDNCPSDPNSDQSNADGDWLGDICDGLTEPPSITVPGDQHVQYSDRLEFNVSATDPDDPPASLWFSAIGLCAGLALTDNLDGTATVSGAAQSPEGTCNADITVTDPDGLSDSGTVSIHVAKEDAVIAYTGDALVLKGSPVILRAAVSEAVEAGPSPGDITKAAVYFDVTAGIGGGTATYGPAPVSAGGEAVWTFPAGLNTNLYSVDVRMDATNGYYQAAPADTAALVVYDPSAGFTTGGGWVWDGAAHGNFGFSAKYLKSGGVQGQALYVYRQGDSVVRVKSNAMRWLVINGKTAVFQGKATVNGTGNYTFEITVADNGEPGRADTFAIKLWAPDGALVHQLAPTTLGGGNLIVPQPKRR